MKGHLVTVLTSCCLALGGWALLLLVDVDKKVAVLEMRIAETKLKVDKNYDLIKTVLIEVSPINSANTERISDKGS
tara:strand:+ start:66 stop:293 length:228 start_codon:yes stop_codon:yes gene_type:complete